MKDGIKDLLLIVVVVFVVTVIAVRTLGTMWERHVLMEKCRKVGEEDKCALLFERGQLDGGIP